MLKEEAAYRLAETFINEYKKFGKYLFNMKTVDKSRWWVHFERAAGYRSVKGWTPEVHVKSCFEKYGEIMPFRLFGKTALEAWEEYHHRYEEDGKNDYVVQMLDTFKKIKKWSHNGYKADYFNQDLIPFWYRRNNYSIHFLSLSKTFRERNRVEHLVDEEVLNTKRQVVFTNKQVYKKMQEVLGEDFYRGE